MICHMTCAHKAGDTRIFHKECKTLAQNSFDTHLIACAGEQQDSAIDDVNIHLLPRKNTSRILRMLFSAHGVYSKARKLGAKVYHIHDPELLPYALLLRAKGALVIYDAHEDVPRQILNKYWIAKPIRGVIAWCFERFENFAAKRMSAVVAATPFIRDRFIKINSNTVDICNYPDLAEFDAEPDGNKDPRAICYAGAISISRGIITMLDALQNIDARLNLCGEFETPQLKQQAMSHPAWEKVNYYGFVDRKTIASVLRKSSVGLCVLKPLPNYIDSLPIKLFEYMAASVPVVASNFPLWKSIVEQARCGIFVDPDDTGAISKAINYLLENAETAQAMGERGREAVLGKYNFESEGKKLIKLYNGLLQGAN